MTVVKVDTAKVADGSDGDNEGRRDGVGRGDRRAARSVATKAPCEAGLTAITHAENWGAGPSQMVGPSPTGLTPLGSGGSACRNRSNYHNSHSWERDRAVPARAPIDRSTERREHVRYLRRP